MLQRIADNWWVIKFYCEEGKYVWFGFSEDEVKAKFNAFMRKWDMKRQHYLFEGKD